MGWGFQGCGEVGDGPPFFGHDIPPPQLLAHPAIQRVELQKNRVQPRFGKLPQIARLPGNAQTVCIELEKRESLLPPDVNDLR